MLVNRRGFARREVGHPLAVQVVAGFVNAFAAILVEPANDRANPDDAGADRVEVLVSVASSASFI